MAKVQIRYIERPFDTPVVARKAVAALNLAEAMGLLPEGKPIERLDPKTVEEVARSIAAAGIGRAHAAAMSRLGSRSPEEVAAALDALSRAMEESPLPEREWPALITVLGNRALERLLDLSTSTVRRYWKAQRQTPPEVADKLHWLVQVVSDLAGSYNEHGIRRWFERPRAQLGGKSPIEALARSWTPEKPAAASVRALARSLLGSSAT